MDDYNEAASNLRSAVINETNLMPPTGIGLNSNGPVLRTPHAGNVRALPPPLPHSPFQQQQQLNQPYSYGGFGAFGGPGLYNGYSGFGNAISYGSYGGFGGGFNTYGAGYGNSYNRFGNGMNPMDPESRFIQMAEASSRPAFQSIESLVGAISNIAAMLDSTFFALTSSFRSILGVAANFGRLRSVFAQFWTTFAIFRGINWVYRKLLYWLRISNMDPSSDAFKKAYSEALAGPTNGASPSARKTQSPWPVVAFISFIFSAPYLIMKLLGTVTQTAQDEARNPQKWLTVIKTKTIYDFQARNPSELSFPNGAIVQIAPKEIQQTLGLLNTGWALATIDGRHSGLIPLNYVKSPTQLQQEREQQLQQEQLLISEQMKPITATESDLSNNLSPAAFPPASVNDKISSNDDCDFEIASQPMAPPTTDMSALAEGFF